MHERGLTQRLTGGAATCLLLGVAAWQFVTAGAPRGAVLVSVLLVAAAAAVAAVALRLRLAARVKSPLTVLVHGLASIAIATSVLALLGPYLKDPVPLSIVTFVAVLLTVNPASRAWVLVTLWLSSLVALGVVWYRIGALAAHGTAGLLAVETLVGSVPLLAFTNWSLTDRLSRLQTRRLRATGDAARHIGAATTVSDVVEAALLTCRETYPQATFGAVLTTDENRRWLVNSPLYLGPSGLTRQTGTELRIGPGEGVSGTVFASGRSLLLPTRRDIAAAYAGTTEPRRETLRLHGGGSDAACFIAAPMHSLERHITGVLLLNSHLREHAWEREDLTVVEAIADQTAVAIERARLYEKQQIRANTDALTGLQNRRAFDDLLNGAHPGPLAILAIDVDNLKSVNDRHGHEAGDMLLIRVAATLAGQARHGDIVARLGGDEFVAVLFGADTREAAAIAERMRSSLQGISLPHGPAEVSIGIAAAGPGSPARSAWSRADAALAAAKRAGRNRVDSGERARPSALRRVHDLEPVIDAVLADPSRIRPVFQPVVRLSDFRVAGYEALARLPQGSAGGDGVADVFATAQRLGRLRDLDWLCRRRAVDGARHLPDGVPLFINVSALALLDPVHPVDQTLLLLRMAGRDPGSVVLEVSEREPIHDRRRLRYVLASYREHGVRFAIDDLGEGSAPLELLAAAVPEYIKLGPKLCATLGELGSRASVEAALAFAREASSQVIAEGVESLEAAERLAGAGVELAQGFCFARLARGLSGVSAGPDHRT